MDKQSLKEKTEQIKKERSQPGAKPPFFSPEQIHFEWENDVKSRHKELYGEDASPDDHYYFDKMSIHDLRETYHHLEHQIGEDKASQILNDKNEFELPNKSIMDKIKGALTGKKRTPTTEPTRRNKNSPSG